MASFEIPHRIPVRSSAIFETKTAARQISPWWLVADRIQDPGNLGTMIRIADWFGFEGLICSPETVNCYNSKVIQASMGSLFRIPVHYSDLNPYDLTRLTGMNVSDFLLEEADKDAEFDSHQSPWMVAAMPGGIDLNRIQFPEQGGMLLVGNESQGLSQNVLRYASHLVGIPSFGGAESLNAAVATGIFASAIRKSETRESCETRESETS
jgi:TrmH family RNA methyltransferase